MKIVRSPEYNSIFRATDGFFARWGKTVQENPFWCPIGPEIMDIEISTMCHRACAHCYKSNGPIGKNMPMDVFRHILGILPVSVTQIAFGTGDTDAHPQLGRMFEETRARGIVPNITINGERLHPNMRDTISKYCGAVGVSLYDIDACIQVCESFAENIGKGSLKQINVQAILARETLDKILQFVELLRSSELRKTVRLVLLNVKPKGRRNTLRKVSFEKFSCLVKKIMESNVVLGMDSCTACQFVRVAQELPNWELMKQSVEPCESTLFSYYINVDGIGYPCSFVEGEPGWNGVDVTKVGNFADVWNHPETERFRNMIRSQNAEFHTCPIFDLHFENESQSNTVLG